MKGLRNAEGFSSMRGFDSVAIAAFEGGNCNHQAINNPQGSLELRLSRHDCDGSLAENKEKENEKPCLDNECCELKGGNSNRTSVDVRELVSPGEQTNQPSDRLSGIGDEEGENEGKSIFKKRVELKPYEYPQLLQYRDAIRHSYWLHTEFTLTGDIQDWFTKTSYVERSILKRTMLAISQVEVAVKTFWSRIYDRMPKPEIAEVGMTFAESEVRHANAYSFLLEALRLDEDFKKLRDIPAINKRIEYLSEVQKHVQSQNPRQFILTLLLFSSFVEHVSLFSQFLIMMSFNRYKGIFKAISNIVEATSKEEQIHGLFGQELTNIVKSEHPEWFDSRFEQELYEFVKIAFQAEREILGWIFEEGELEFLQVGTVEEFLKSRFNRSMEGVGYRALFQVNQELLSKTRWFDEELVAKKENDFFNKRNVDYSKKVQQFTADSLF